MIAWLFSSPSGGDQFISLVRESGCTILKVFVSFWRRSVHITATRGNHISSSCCRFSSPSGGDQFISIKGLVDYLKASKVFVSFWRRSVHIRSPLRSRERANSTVFVSFWRRSVHITYDDGVVAYPTLFSSPSGGDQFISKEKERKR